MHKVVFNNCYGGFSISLKAIEWLECNSKDESLLAHIKRCKKNRDWSIAREQSIALVDQMLCYNVSEFFDDKRHHKDLVAVVEALGKDANGECAELDIAKVYSKQYRIDDYDGVENVITPNGYDWIFIED